MLRHQHADVSARPIQALNRRGASIWMIFVTTTPLMPTGLQKRGTVTIPRDMGNRHAFGMKTDPTPRISEGSGKKERKRSISAYLALTARVS
jgi:hypothetical protein